MASFEDLSPEAQKIVHDRRVSGEKSIKEWIDFINPLSRFDRKSDLQRKIGNYIMGLWAFVGLYGIYMTFQFMYNHVEPIKFLEPLIVLASSGLLMLLTYMYYRKFEVMDIPNLLRGFLEPVLKLLREEFGDNAKLNLKLDLSEIKALREVTAEAPETDPMTYLETSITPKEGSTAAVKVEATGVEQPFLSEYKLRHTVYVSCAFDKSRFNLGENTENFAVSEDGDQFVIKYKFSEQSEQTIEEDTGPGEYHLAKRLHLMFRMGKER